jgi:hypothetical protein
VVPEAERKGEEEVPFFAAEAAEAAAVTGHGFILDA